MSDVNRWVGTGRLTKDPEDTRSEGVKFDIANNGFGDEVSYPRIVVGVKNGAEACRKYLVKGSRVAVDGRLKQYTWEDDKTGQSRTMWFVSAQSVVFLDPKDKMDKEGKAPSGNIPF